MNRLVKVTDTDGVVEAAFVYDRAGFLVKEMNAADYLSADTDEERTGTYYTYDFEGDDLVDKQEHYHVEKEFKVNG
ncbi:rHS repeat-associated core domain-containing protein [Roseburia sp. CAG:197]|nr:rHS repeat-associated core domain-containing protein [Roseburia sp. CAG:197]